MDENPPVFGAMTNIVTFWVFGGRTVIDDVIYGNPNPGFPGFGNDGFADPSCDTHKKSLIC